MSLYNIDELTHIDEYGVDHSDFNNRQELEYNIRRAREQEEENKKSSSASQGRPLPTSKWDGIFTSAVESFLEGVLGGMSRYANTATMGAFGKTVDYFGNNAYTHHQNALQKQAEDAGLKYSNMLANSLIDTAASLSWELPNINNLLKMK